MILFTWSRDCQAKKTALTGSKGCCKWQLHQAGLPSRRQPGRQECHSTASQAQGWGGHFFACQCGVEAGSNDTSVLQRVTGQLCDRTRDDQPPRMAFGRGMLLASQGGWKKRHRRMLLCAVLVGREGGVLNVCCMPWAYKGVRLLCLAPCIDSGKKWKWE